MVAVYAVQLCHGPLKLSRSRLNQVSIRHTSNVNVDVGDGDWVGSGERGRKMRL